MKSHFLIRLLGVAAVICALLGTVATASAKTSVFVSIVPQEYFVEQIGKDLVDVQALVTPGGSPATYEPTPRQMAALSEAKLFFRIGVPFENAFVPKVEETMKGIRIVDTRAGISLREMKAHHHHEDEHAAAEHHEGHAHEEEGHHEEHAHHDEKEHAHHDEKEHAHHDENEHAHHDEKEHAHHAKEEKEHHHGGTDPHLWLSPRLVKIQARTIADALIEVDPAGKATYEKNLAAFHKDLDALDAKLVEALAPVKGKTFMVFHPAWGYFADAYGLEQEPIEIEGKDPSGQQLARMIDMAKDEGVRVIFVQPQFSSRSAKRVAEAIGGAVVPIDPLARDYIANLEQVATTVREALQK